jgi:aminoacyl-tRNA hydrolase
MNHYLIVGLGNPTGEYDGTRHNIGFRIVDYIAEHKGWTWSTARYGEITSGRIKNVQVTLLKPSTYMNLSGTAVRYWLQELKTPKEHLLICLDDLALPFGVLRMKSGGSTGGHNGLKHITELLGTDKYPRLRFGIGHDFPRGKQIEYVLARFSEGELADMSGILNRVEKMVESFCLMGIERTMNDYN